MIWSLKEYGYAASNQETEAWSKQGSNSKGPGAHKVEEGVMWSPETGTAARSAGTKIQAESNSSAKLG